MLSANIQRGQIWKQNNGEYLVRVDWVTLYPHAGIVGKTQRVGLIGISDKEEYNVEAKWLLNNFKLRI